MPRLIFLDKILRKYLKKLTKVLRRFSNFEVRQIFSVVLSRFLNRISKFLSFSLIFLHNFYLYSLEILFLLLNITIAQAVTPQTAISLAVLFLCLAGHMAMHACQIGPTDTAPFCPGSPHRACVGTRLLLWNKLN